MQARASNLSWLFHATWNSRCEILKRKFSSSRTDEPISQLVQALVYARGPARIRDSWQTMGPQVLVRKKKRYGPEFIRPTT